MSTHVVLITGALTGIGRAAALAFAREGHRIVVAGRHEQAGQELATELRALGTEVEFLRADIRHEDDVRNLVASARRGSVLPWQRVPPAFRARTENSDDLGSHRAHEDDSDDREGS